MASNSDERSKEMDDSSEEETLATLKRKADVNDDSDADKRQRTDAESDDEGLLPGIFVKVEVEELNDQDNADGTAKLNRPMNKPNKRKSRPPTQRVDPDFVTDWRPPKRKKNTSCPDCGKVFSNKNEMKQHSIEHQVQTRHKCDECGRCFSKAFGLKTHKRMHGEKDQHCPLCEASFTLAINLSPDDVRPSKSQRSALVEFLEATPQALMAPKLNEKQWASVARTLNSMGEVKKDGQGWYKYWTEMKSKLKTLCAQKGTTNLSKMGRKMVALMKLTNDATDIVKEPNIAPAPPTRPTYNQMRELVAFLELNPDVALSLQSARLESKDKWAALAEKLNQMGGVVKDGVGWTKFWCEKKSYLKRVCTRKREKFQPTELSTLERRLIAVLGFELNGDTSRNSTDNGPQSGTDNKGSTSRNSTENVPQSSTDNNGSEEQNDTPVFEQEKDQLDLERVKAEANSDVSQASPTEQVKRPQEAAETPDVSKVAFSSRPNYAQRQMLTQFLERNPGVARGSLRTAQGRIESKAKWASMAKKMNPLGPAKRDGPGWSKFWSEKKFHLKRLVNQRRALSAFDARMWSVVTSTATEYPVNDGEDTTVVDEQEDTSSSPRPSRKVTEEADSHVSQESPEQMEVPVKRSQNAVETPDVPKPLFSSKPNDLQTEKLIVFLERNPGVAKGLLRTVQGKGECKAKWAFLANKLNPLGPAKRDGPGWSKFWSEKKAYLKRIVNLGRASTMSAYDAKMAAILDLNVTEEEEQNSEEESEDEWSLESSEPIVEVKVEETKPVIPENETPKTGKTPERASNPPQKFPGLNCCRPSHSQLLALAEFLNSNLEVLEGDARTARGRLSTKNKWAAIAAKLNAIGGARRDRLGWAKYWYERKCYLKKTSAISGGEIPELFVQNGRLHALTSDDQSDADASQDSQHSDDDLDKDENPSSPSEVEKDDDFVMTVIEVREQSSDVPEPLDKSSNTVDNSSNTVDKSSNAVDGKGEWRWNYKSVGRMSYAQAVRFVELLEKNPSIVSMHRSMKAKHEAKKLWEQLASEMNKLEGSQKDGAGWAKYWLVKKSHLRKVCAAKAYWWLSELDTRIMAAIAGPDFATSGRDIFATCDQCDSASAEERPTSREADLATGAQEAFATSRQNDSLDKQTVDCEIDGSTTVDQKYDVSSSAPDIYACDQYDSANLDQKPASSDPNVATCHQYTSATVDQKPEVTSARDMYSCGRYDYATSDQKFAISDPNMCHSATEDQQSAIRDMFDTGDQFYSSTLNQNSTSGERNVVTCHQYDSASVEERSVLASSAQDVFATGHQNESATVDEFSRTDHDESMAQSSAKLEETRDDSLSTDEEDEMALLEDSDDPLSTGDVLDETELDETELDENSAAPPT